MTDKAQLTNTNEYSNEYPMVLGLRANSITYRIYQLLKKHPEDKWNIKGIRRELHENPRSIYSALRRLLAKSLILKFPYPTFCEYGFPSTSLDAERAAWDFTKGLGYNKMHNIMLFHQATNKLTIYGVEQALGGRTGFREWFWGKDFLGNPIKRTIKWILGYNINKSKPPSITIRMACSDRPISLPDDWVSFLIYLDGMLSLHILEHPEQWQLLTAHFHNDYRLGPNYTTLEKPVDIKSFTDAICRLYDKQIDGLWYRRDEKCFAADANYAPSLQQWKVQNEAGIVPYAAENLVVGALNTISQESRATRVSQRRLENAMLEFLKELKKREAKERRDQDK